MLFAISFLKNNSLTHTTNITVSLYDLFIYLPLNDYSILKTIQQLNKYQFLLPAAKMIPCQKPAFDSEFLARSSQAIAPLFVGMQSSTIVWMSAATKSVNPFSR